MPFTATEAIIGDPKFGLVHIDPQETAKAFQKYLDTASKLTGVSLDDISLVVSELPADSNKASIAELTSKGMRLFDAVVWITAGRPTTHPLVADPSMTPDKIPSSHEIARSVFYCYFMLVVQARYPASQNDSDPPKIPNFLKTIMGMDKPQHTYVEAVCSFNPTKFDPKWAKYVKFQGFGQEVLSRFGLGVAGYRMFGPFGLYKPGKTLTPELTAAYNFARSVSMTPATWSIHPLTRDPNVLTKRGNLNKNLTNLLLDCFTEEQLKEMEVAKIIYKMPEREPTHRNYLTWAENDDISGTDRILS